jgi:hypothetical protein
MYKWCSGGEKGLRGVRQGAYLVPTSSTPQSRVHRRQKRTNKTGLFGRLEIAAPHSASWCSSPVRPIEQVQDRHGPADDGLAAPQASHLHATGPMHRVLSVDGG